MGPSRDLIFLMNAAARLAVCVVSRESRFANAQLNEIARFAISNCAAEVANIEIEML